MGSFCGFFDYYSTRNIKGGVKNFSILHFSWLVVCVILLIVLVAVYKELNEYSRERFIKFCAVMLLSLYMLRMLWTIVIGKFSSDSMLPFHLCAIMVFVDFLAVFSNKRILKEFGYSAGLPGAFVAYLTPDINGFPLLSLQYQVYIFDHFFLILIPLLWLIGDGFKPHRTYSSKVTTIMAIVAFADIFINKIFKSNYMFVSKAPAGTPFVAIQNRFGYLGYLIFLVFGACVTIWLMYRPWEDIQKNAINMDKEQKN